MAGATVRIEGQSDVGSVVSADLAKAQGALKGIESGAGNAVSPLNAVNGVLGSIQQIAVAGGLYSAASALYELGGAAQEAYGSLNGLTGGNAPQYINAVTEGSDGMISKLDAAQISTRALNYGMSLTADQMGRLSKASAEFADVTGKTTVDAENTLIDAIGRGNTRMLAQLGIVEKGKDVTADINALMAANGDLTYTQAAQIASLNAVLERSNQLQEAGIGAQRSASDSAERLAASWKNLTTTAGQATAAYVQPAVEGANQIVSGVNSVNDAVDTQRQRLMDNTASWDDYVKQAQNIPYLSAEVAKGMGAESESLQRLRAQWEANHTAILNNRAALYEVMDARRNDMATTTAFATTMDDLTSSFDAAKTAADNYQKVLDQQATLQAITIGSIAALSGAKATEKGAYDYATGALDKYGFSAAKTQQMSLDLALATHQVTNAQVELAATVQGSENMWANGIINAQAFANELATVRAGGDAAMASLQAVADSVSAAYATAATSGQGYIAATSQAMADTAASSLKDAKDAASKVQAVFDGLSPELKINADTTAVMTALNGIELQLAAPKPPIKVEAITAQADQQLLDTQKILDAVQSKKVTVTVNFVATGDTWAASGASGAGNGPGGWTGGIVGYAGGTLNFPGGIGMVGEMGPELVHLPGGSHIYNAGETQSMLNGASGGSVVNISLNAVGVNDPAALVDMIEREIRARGKSFGAVR